MLWLPLPGPMDRASMASLIFPRVKLEQMVRLGNQEAQGHLEMR